MQVNEFRSKAMKVADENKISALLDEMGITESVPDDMVDVLINELKGNSQSNSAIAPARVLAKTTDMHSSIQKQDSSIEFRPVQTLDRQQVAVELAKATQQAEEVMIRIDSVDEQEYKQLENYFDELSQYIEQLNQWQQNLAQASLNKLMSGRINALSTLAEGMETIHSSTQKQLEVLRQSNRDRFRRMEEQFARFSS